MQERNIIHQPTTGRDTIGGGSLQAQAQRFLLDLQLSVMYGACNETPAHKVWTITSRNDPCRPAYAYGSYEQGGGPIPVLSARWGWDPTTVEAYVDDVYGEQGQSPTYTPETWADWLGMPVAVYIKLRDLVRNGQVATLWALINDGDITPPSPTTDHQWVADVLAAARRLPPARNST
jgi:hypothetical protein